MELKENLVPYNKILGHTPGGIPAFSNGDDEFFSMERHFLHGIFMGFKWQCVEFARRWAVLKRGYFFGDIPTAADMWEQLVSVKQLDDGMEIAVQRHGNGAPAPPPPNSLLIWPRSEDNRFGHVAVITHVLKNAVRIAEQNKDFGKWPGDYARELPLVFRDGKYYIEDREDPVTGWLVFQDESDDHHVEESTANLDLLEDDKLLDGFKSTPPSGQLIRQSKTIDHSVVNSKWLDANDPPEKTFIDAFGEGAVRKSDKELIYYEATRDLLLDLSGAANTLHRLCLKATKRAIGSDTILKQMGIPEALFPAIRKSWRAQRNFFVFGRFDISVDGKNLKMFEYNADNPATLFECAVIQKKWAEAVGLASENSPIGGWWSSGYFLHGRLVSRWKNLIQSLGNECKLVHMLIDSIEVDEKYTAEYLQKVLREAGMASKVCDGLSGFSWKDGQIVDSDGVPLRVVWKTWSWNTVFNDFQKTDPAHPREKPGLSDILLHPSILVVEPIWKVVMNNKGLLPVISEMFPNHPHLLRAEFQVSEELKRSGYVSKPLRGRCGMQVELVGADGSLIESTTSTTPSTPVITPTITSQSFDKVYQELVHLPAHAARYPVLGAWMVGDVFSGFGIREDASRITQIDSPYMPCRIAWK